MENDKLLLIWELVPEETQLYAFDAASDIAEIARNAAGKYINQNNEEGDAVEQLSERLADYAHCRLDDNHVKGLFSEAVVCGFML